jgi:hypothetical protein
MFYTTFQTAYTYWSYVMATMAISKSGYKINHIFCHLQCKYKNMKVNSNIKPVGTLVSAFLRTFLTTDNLKV